MKKKDIKETHTNPHPSEKSSFLSNKYSYLLLTAILLLALILRVAALLSLKNSIYFDFLLWDEQVYHTWAKKIIDGTYHSTSVYQFAPLHAYVMAFIYKLFSPDILYIRVLNIVLGVLICYFVYLIGKEMAHRAIGLIAAFVACLYEPFILYSIVPLKASLSALLFAVTIYCFTAVFTRHSLIKIFLMGMAIGLMLSVRPHCIVLIPFIPLFLLWNFCKSESHFKKYAATILLYVLGVTIALAPFMIRNYRVAGRLALTTSQSGFNLYQSSKLDRPGPVAFATTSPFEQGIQFTIEASRRVGKKLSAGEASSYWVGETMKLPKEQPVAFTRNLFKKTLRFFREHQLTDHYNIDFLSGHVPFFKFPFFRLWLIFPLGMAGMAVNVRGSRKLQSLSLIFLLYALTQIILFTLTRYRLPLLVIIIPFAIMGVEKIMVYFQTRRFTNIAAYTVTATVFFLIASFPSSHSGDMTAYYNIHAIILNTKGMQDKALWYWEKSSRMNGLYSDFANLSLASIHFTKRDIEKTQFYLEKISGQSYAAAQKYDTMGDVMIYLRQVRQAVFAYEKSLAINSGQRRVRVKLIRIFERIDPRRAAIEREKLDYINSFYDTF
ncbi:glycosyltransferase family 39 protein [Thermodesulfobacteriota bacterium]